MSSMNTTTKRSRYTVRLVSKEADRIKKFVSGLRPEIRSKLVLFQLQIYIQAVEKALKVK